MISKLQDIKEYGMKMKIKVMRVGNNKPTHKKQMNK